MNTPVYTLDNFVPHRAIGYLIKQAAKLATMRMEEQLVGCELTPSHWVAMSLVKHGLADNCATLARRLGHNSGAITRLIDQLDERGLVRRCREGGDRRVVTLDVTPAGDDQLAQLTPLMLDIWNAALGEFDRDEIDRLIAMLTRLVAALDTRPAGDTE